MLVFNQVTKTYTQGQMALNAISFEIQKGEIAFITGHSGAGKSSILKCAALIERPTSGQIFINDQPIHHLKKSQVPVLRQQIGLIFQDPKLLSDRSIFDNIALPLVIMNYSQSDIKKRVHAALDKVGFQKKASLLPSTLSNGEKQRLCIARAIVHKPALLLADEPTGNLDPNSANDILKLLLQFKQVGVTILYATHNLPQIPAVQPHILTLREGRLL